MTTAFFTHGDCVKHEISPGHPECPERIAAITDRLKEDDLFDHLAHFEAPIIESELLVRAHGEQYVTEIIESSPESGRVQLDADTAMNPYSLNASMRAAGAGIQATRQVLSGEYSSAFCAVRPPGHHAERTRAMGFCFFGSAAVAAFYALEELGLDRVAIVDFDVHHGNGTEDIVHDDSRILFCSSFQHPFYPGYFRPSVPGQLVNVPLPAGTNGAKFREAISSTWFPELRAFNPQLLIISAGFDAHADDPLASLMLGDEDFHWVTEQLVDIADKCCDGKIVSLLEGGYSLSALGRSASEHLRVLMSV